MEVIVTGLKKVAKKIGVAAFKLATLGCSGCDGNCGNCGMPKKEKELNLK